MKNRLLAGWKNQVLHFASNLAAQTEKGPFVLKILSVSFAIAIAAAWSDPAYSFDKERFYSNVSIQIGAGASRFYFESQIPEDQFSVGPTGRIEKILNSTTLNMFASDKSQDRNMKSDDTTRKPYANPTLKSNIDYSLVQIKPQADGECGPSPMTAEEIEALIVETAETYSVDPGFAKAIAWTESRFDRDRNSEQGARGTMQLMPSTALELGVRDICDPVSNIDGGVRYLKRMLDEFHNPILAAAAYNAGAQAVYDNGGVPPYPETVRYVAAVINHQMGLQIARKSSVRGISSITETTPSNEITTEVIGARGSRFVKGVMQF